MSVLSFWDEVRSYRLQTREYQESKLRSNGVQSPNAGLLFPTSRWSSQKLQGKKAHLLGRHYRQVIVEAARFSLLENRIDLPVASYYWSWPSTGEREIIEEGCSIGFIDADAFTFKTSILQSDTKCLGLSSPQKGRAPVEDPSKVPEGRSSSPTPLKKQRVLPAWMTKDSKNTELTSEPKETSKCTSNDFVRFVVSDVSNFLAKYLCFIVRNKRHSLCYFAEK